MKDRRYCQIETIFEIIQLTRLALIPMEIEKKT